MASNFVDDSDADSLTVLKETFDQAAKYLRTSDIVGKLESEQLLHFYARFKQASEGPCDTQRPGFFDFQGKQKWDAWHKLGAMTSAVAMEEYVAAMNDLDPEWQLKVEDIQGQPSKQWVAVSTMQQEESLADVDKTVFDWCKEGDIKRTQSLLTRINVNDKDEEGMTLLHWACDRGLEDMVRILLEHRADVNSRDNEGQTPLHYAAACEHVAVVETLLAGGADVSIRDAEGLTPAEAADSQAMVDLLMGR